jgi:hypothetical protein
MNVIQLRRRKKRDVVIKTLNMIPMTGMGGRNWYSPNTP